MTSLLAEREARVADDARREAGWGQGAAAVGGHQSDAGDRQRPSSLPRTHASFFSGIGGLDLGFERAGWRTVSFSEIEPYACAVLALRWPHVPNLGSITSVVDVPDATVWSGGFPCQDLSIAGKRAGLAGARSGLALTFLDLVETHRPPIVVLENVMGLRSSNLGHDLLALVRRLADMGYMGAWRSLDAQFFGVAQRRRRIFLVGFNEDTFGDSAEGRAGAVLFEPESGSGHPPAVVRTPERAADDLARSVTASSHKHHDPDTDTYIAERVASLDQQRGGVDDNDARGGRVIVEGASPDSAGGGAPDGLPRRLDDRAELEEDLNPPGLDAYRFRGIGNGVVTPVAEWLGRRLIAHMEYRP